MLGRDRPCVYQRRKLAHPGHRPSTLPPPIPSSNARLRLVRLRACRASSQPRLTTRRWMWLGRLPRPHSVQPLDPKWSCACCRFHKRSLGQHQSLTCIWWPNIMTMQLVITYGLPIILLLLHGQAVLFVADAGSAIMKKRKWINIKRRNNSIIKWKDTKDITGVKIRSRP